MSTIIISIGDNTEAHSVTNLPKVSQHVSDRAGHIGSGGHPSNHNALLPQSYSSEFLVSLFSQYVA